MNGKKLIAKLIENDMLSEEVLVGILLCDPPTSKARIHRFSVTEVLFREGSDSLDTASGEANELTIHQNESLASHGSRSKLKPYMKNVVALSLRQIAADLLDDEAEGERVEGEIEKLWETMTEEEKSLFGRFSSVINWAMKPLNL